MNSRILKPDEIAAMDNWRATLVNVLKNYPTLPEETKHHWKLLQEGDREVWFEWHASVLPLVMSFCNDNPIKRSVNGLMIRSGKESTARFVIAEAIGPDNAESVVILKEHPELYAQRGVH